MKHKKNHNDRFLSHQDQVNVEIFNAIEALGQRLKSTETTHNYVEDRLEDLESGAEVDQDTGKYYLPLVIDPAQLPDTIGTNDSKSSKTMVLSSFVSMFIAITALIVVLMQETTPQSSLTAGNAQFTELNIPWATEDWETVEDVGKQAEQERIISILMQRLEKNEQMMAELQQRQTYVENQYAKALLNDMEVAESSVDKLEKITEIEPASGGNDDTTTPNKVTKNTPQVTAKTDVLKKVETAKVTTKTTTKTTIPKKATPTKSVKKDPTKQAPIKTVQKTTGKAKKLLNRKADTSLPSELRAIEAKALEGDSAAQHDLAALYASGQVIPVNYKNAAYWFLKAAENGVANAHYNLGVMYHQGMGLERNVKKALYWYKEAASLAHPEALYNLGIAYVEGIGTSVDTNRGIGYLKRAANVGVAQAAYNLGVLYEGHFTNEQDSIEKAVKWYDYAGRMGYAEGTASASRLLGRENTVQTAGYQSKSSNVLDIPDNLNNIETAAGYELFPPVAVMEEGSADDSYDTRTTTYPVQLVSRIQRVLIDMNLLPATAPTGKLDLKTTDAIRTFQRKSNMVVDGIPSQDLLDFLITNK